MTRSVSFYKNILGLPLKFESKEWTEFATEDVTLALHISDAVNPNPVQPERAGICRWVFQVPNLDEFHIRMIENNVLCQKEPTVVFGSKVAQYIDPDGMIFSVGEAA